MSRGIPSGQQVIMNCLPYKGVVGTLDHYGKWFGRTHAYVIIEGGPLYSGKRVVHVPPRNVRPTNEAL